MPADRTFSVVIPAYQAAAWLPAALASVLAQDPPPFEVVVVDDGSTDDTPAVLAAHADRVRAFHQPNGGEAAARNRGVHEARGDYVVYLDADDEFLPGRLAALHAALDADPGLDIVTTDAWICVDGTDVGRIYGAHHPFCTDDQPTEILRRNFVFGHAAARRTKIVEVGGYDTSLRHACDWDIWLRMIRAGSRVGFVPEPLSRNHRHAESLSADRVAMTEGELAVLRKAVPLVHDERGRAVLADAIASFEREVAIARLRRALRRGDTRDVRAAARAVAAHPTARGRVRVTAQVAQVVPGLARRAAQAIDARRARRAPDPHRPPER